MSAQINHSLIDGLACLQALAATGQPVGGRELARNLDLNPMRVNRLLMTLAEIGLAQQDEKKRYFIGPGIHALAAQAMFSSGILKKALPLLKEVTHVGMTLAIGVLWREHVTYLFHGKVGEDVEQGIGRMGLCPASQSSIGMLLLSHLQNKEIDTIFSGDVPGYTNVQSVRNQKVGRRKFFSEIDEIRTQHYAAMIFTNKEEGRHCSLAVGIGGPRPVAALAFSGLPVDVDRTAFVKEMQEISENI